MFKQIKILMIVCLSMVVIPLTATAQPAPEPGNCNLHIDIDDFTDEKSHWLLCSSKEYGNYSKTVVMVIYCYKNNTGVSFSEGGYVFESTEGSYRDEYHTNYRLDSDPPLIFRGSATHDALSVGQGNSSIEFIKEMFGHATLKVGIRTSRSRPTHTFNISDIEHDIKPIREDCGW